MRIDEVNKIKAHCTKNAVLKNIEIKNYRKSSFNFERQILS